MKIQIALALGGLLILVGCATPGPRSSYLKRIEPDGVTNLTAFQPPKTSSKNQNGCISAPVGTTLDEATRILVQATIQECAGNKLQAAKILGIAPRTMYRHFSNSGE